MKSVLPILIIITAIKILLIPSYYSTDFHVHRNWLAITRHLPPTQWYFDDVDGGTVHTLDYPPGFAWFEYLLSNNFITNRLIERGWLDGRCLELLPDDNNTPSDRCVAFHRCTVILSDAVLFLGAYLASTAYWDQFASNSKENAQLSFALIVTNPGLIMLDHIHFQYNGMLLGLLLCSIACIIRGAAGSYIHQSKKSSKHLAISSRTWELCGAAFFAILLSMKHLYMTLAPLYLVYLLRHHCFFAQKEQSSVTLQFSLKKFIFLGVITVVCFLGPFVPFLMQDPIAQMEQILKRLFPFGRGLVHDYWAANIWALYLFTSKIASFVKKSFIPSSVRNILESYALVPFPEPLPHIVALCLLMGLAPALICAWKAASNALERQLSNSRGAGTSAATFFVHAVVFCSFSAFMLGYHVHEKAIMTAIIPLTLVSTSSIENARLFIRTCMFGIFGLFPLLFQPEELLIKAFLFLTWMLVALYGLESLLFKDGKDTLLTNIDMVTITVLSCVFIFMEIIHPVVFMPRGKLEFLPLMTTSVVCAIGLFYCWIQSGVQMMNCTKSKAKSD